MAKILNTQAQLWKWALLVFAIGLPMHIVAGVERQGASETGGSTSQQVTPKVNNYARFVKEMQGVPLFHWRVFIDEPPEVLTAIAEVQYELHPSFNDPLQVRTDPATQFALDRGGWGEFRLPVTIRFKDGRVIRTSYQLDLRKPWPAEVPSEVPPLGDRS